ncbi:Initiation-specific alpha-1,6-mannosyltransferase [Wickerhamomyces ciferrii]|uniref:Initiation-specific alpha-1,6-mannosyltransferase n=1 Tax=Wickerhamomyces ciferrii (strain ATCC 14091 / BCRC 22168 / CBS 111 / JCM 3599 / NBRC 0793 / NRRL Y-1031 F-60-10) TaxID=1206466 RepID=K0KMP9_WICCF|nr:Initiation-specific alpha-1,6-mannosyltransferase [Wickerhamomyces ciferrii]CCH42393.1 Initiation-specific alpha-1,6-mannosyltransferase [Wickerhamomyces ciferrii]
MFPAFNKKRTCMVLIVLLVLLNISIPSVVYFHEPTKLRVNKAYKDYYTGYQDVDEYKIHNVYAPNDIRSKLAKHFPYKKSTEKSPRYIWQMWKTTDITTLDENLQKLIETWRTQTVEEKGSFRYEMIGDETLSELVNETFAEVPEVAEAFHILPKIILKSDFMRYILMFAFGGIYSDIDTSLDKDILGWLPYEETVFDKENQVGLSIGIESDRDEMDWARNGMARRVQLCQWTLQAKPNHPFYRELIYRISDLALNHFDPETMILTKGGKKYDLNSGSETKFAGVMEWTGPAMFTDTVFEYLNEVYKTSEELNPELNFANEKIIDPNLPLNLLSKVKYMELPGSVHNEYDPIERPFGWQNLTKQEHPILFDDDVLLLPHLSFGNRQGGDLDYAMHHFKGSWKG